MIITVNGEEKEIGGMSVDGYLQTLRLDARALAIELNREILAKKKYATTMLQDGDVMEIVWFVGGG